MRDTCKRGAEPRSTTVLAQDLPSQSHLPSQPLPGPLPKHLVAPSTCPRPPAGPRLGELPPCAPSCGAEAVPASPPLSPQTKDWGLGEPPAPSPRGSGDPTGAHGVQVKPETPAERRERRQPWPGTSKHLIEGTERGCVRAQPCLASHTQPLCPPGPAAPAGKNNISPCGKPQQGAHTRHRCALPAPEPGGANKQSFVLRNAAQTPVPGPEPSPKSTNPGPKSTDPVARFQM